MKVLITGGRGFLGWHVACRLRALHDIEAVRLGRSDLADARRLRELVAGADAVLHLAGVNRAESDEEVHRGNVEPASVLADALVAASRPMVVVYANSIQAHGDSAYGQGKPRAAELLRCALDRVEGALADVHLPNLFGEHGRPHYNSFVATFCELLTQGQEPIVTRDTTVPLLHAQSAAE